MRGAPSRCRRAAAMGAVIVLAVAVGLGTAQSPGSAAAAPGGWLQPRYDAGRSSANPTETHLGPTEVPQLRKSWSHPIPPVHYPHYDSTFISDAAVTPSAVYVASAAGLTAYALPTGRPRWTYVTDGCQPLAGATAVAGLIVARTVEQCSASNGLSQVVAVNEQSGRRVWTSWPGAVPDNHVWSFVVVGDRVYASSCIDDNGADGPCHLTALQVQSGRRLWTRRLSGNFSSTHNVAMPYADGRLFLQNRAYDADTGALRWTSAVGPYYKAAMIAAAGSVFGQDDDAGQLHAFDQATGEVRWRGRGYETPMAVARSILYSIVGDPYVETSGTVNARDTASGRLLWSRRVADLNGAAHDDHGVGDRQMVVADGVVYVGGKDLRALRASDGRMLPMVANGKRAEPLAETASTVYAALYAVPSADPGGYRRVLVTALTPPSR